MKKQMKNIIRLFGLLSMMSLTLSAGAVAPSDMPLIMTLKTNIYGYQGPSNSFTIYLGSTVKNAEFYVETASVEEYIFVDPWTLGTDGEGGNSAIATPVYLNVTETNDEVKIYGDASQLDYIDVHGCYLSSFKLAKELPNLIVVDLSHNELTEIDLSRQTSLASIDISDNAFTDPGKMIIGTNHPDLMILSVGVNDVCDPNLDLRNFPGLQYFSARNNYGLTHVDPTGCPELISLVLEVTNIESIDVSQNKKLDVLNLSQTRVNSVDISNNTLLGEFYLNHEGSYNTDARYKLNDIDVSKNPLLEYLDLGGNNLTSIDLSNNNALKLLYLQHNRLSEIDLSGKNSLSTVNLSYNLFTFATLPIPQEGWDYYYFRSPLSCDLKYMVDRPIDFSSQVIRKPFNTAEGNTIKPVTYANVFATPRGAAEYEVDADLYTYADGVITFHQALPDSVYVQFYCDVFPDWPLNSAKFMVKTEADYYAPSKIFSFYPDNRSTGKRVSLSLGALIISQELSYPADVTVSYGDFKTELKGVVTGPGLPSSPNVTFTLPSQQQEVTISLADGYVLDALKLSDVSINALDVTPSDGLRQLIVTDCRLPSINLSYNRNLQYLDLSNNTLTTLDLSGIQGDYQKYSLTDINLSGNDLRRLTTVSASTIRNLNLAENYFTEFDLKYFTGLKSINLSHNMLSGTVDFSTVEYLESADVSGNSISSLIFNEAQGALDGLKSLNVADNKLSFATLPIFRHQLANYEYVPQHPIEILSVAPSINLSAQNLSAAGYPTTFKWIYSDSGEAVANRDYTETDGAFIFSESLVGKTIYCCLTNPLFPQFGTDNPLVTSDVTIAMRPQNLVATLVTSQSVTAEIGFRFHTSGDNAVYIDWRGDGTEYEPYIYEANGSYPSIYRSGQTFAGATAKIYSYEDPGNISVFALNNTPLKSLDLTPMSKVEAVDVHNAGLEDGSLILPDNGLIWELVLDGNKFKTQSFGKYGKISTLNLARNNYEYFDLSPYTYISYAQLSGNKITNVKFGKNPHLIQADLTANNLKSIDLSETSEVQELLLADNQLTEIDLSTVAGKLRALNISGNNFTFATLPRAEQLGSALTTFYYANQKPMDVECVDGEIDLSAQAMVDGEETEYYWFLGDFQADVYYDYETETFVGEELEGPEVSDDPEYVIEDGITTFLYPQKRSVICAMVNSYYPNLILYTSPTKITDAGIKEAFGYNKSDCVSVYNLNGVKIINNIPYKEALEKLNEGIFIINGKKVLIRKR